jgi:hypothetical protein
VTSSGPNFSPFPFAKLRRVSRRDAALESVIARWVAARPLGARVAKLVGGPVRASVVAVRSAPIDPHAALAEVRLGGQSIVLAAASRPVRALAQRLLGGPAELDAPRPLAAVEHAMWALAIAAAIEDLGVAAEVWPLVDLPIGDRLAIELAVELPGAGAVMTVTALCPPELPVRLPPARTARSWPFELRVVVAGCALPRAALATLSPRDVITVDRSLELRFGDGAIGLSAAPGAIEAAVTTGYVPRDMALPDEAHLELTVQLGTTRLTLRQVAELVPGQIVPLGRPLAGPFEVHAAGRRVGEGELVDVDGELGVRIVSLEE